MEHSQTRANGADLHVARTGQVAPLLVLHGWPEFWLHRRIAHRQVT